MYKFHCFQDHYMLLKWYASKNCQKKFRMTKSGCSKFFLTIFLQITGINSEFPKMVILNFFWQFPQNTGVNLEWPKMAILNFLWQFFPKKLVQIRNGQKWPFWIFPNNFSQKDWYKFGMARNGQSEFFLTIFPKKTGINLERPKMAILNFFWQFFPKRLV